MCTDDTNESFAGDPSEPTEPTAEAAPDSPASGPSDLAPTPPRSGWGRRRFLQAAALGTAAAALININKEGAGLSGLRFGPLPALANDLSGFPCTANDQNVGAGTVVNAPCQQCTGTYCAIVQFPVQNGSGTQRYCDALHLNSLVVNGITIPAQDVILYTTQACAQSACNGNLCNGIVPATCISSSSPKSTIPMYGAICGFPCNPGSGPLTFPNATVAWNTSPGAANCTTANQSPPKGQCEHQAITIFAFGASLGCTAGCAPTCGGTSTLHATVSAPAVTSGTPFTYTLNTVDCVTGAVLTQVATSGPTAATFWDFIVTAPPGTTCYAVTVCDSRLGTGCCRTSTAVSLTVLSIATPTLTPSTPACNGSTTFTVAPCPPASGVTYTLQEVDCTTLKLVVGSTLTSTYDPSTCTFTALLPQGKTTCVRVKASNGTPACDVYSNTVSVAVNSAPSVLLSLGGANNCNGQLTFTATASGGSGGFTYTFYKNGTQVTSGPSNTLSYGPILDGVCYAFTVTVTDSAGCVSPLSAAISVSQCVTTTSGC
jgi:hypothetical protein